MDKNLDALVRLAGWLRALLAAGQPLPEGLARLARTLTDRRERALVERLSADLASGSTLSAALEKQLGRDLPPLALALIRAGEAGGDLRAAVDAVAGYHEAQRDLARQVSASLLYPRIAILVMVALVLPTLAWVRAQLMSDPGAGEVATAPLFWAIDRLVAVILWPFGFGPIATAALIVLCVLVLFGGFRPLDRFTSWIAWRFETAGAVRRATLAAALSRGLALLLRAGVPVPEALRLMAGSTGDAVAGEQLAAAAGRAESGLSLGQALAPVVALPPSLNWFLELGPGGALEAGLSEAARFYEEEARDRAQLLAAALQPIVLLGLAAAFLPSGAILVRLMALFSMAGSVR